MATPETQQAIQEAIGALTTRYDEHISTLNAVVLRQGNAYDQELGKRKALEELLALAADVMAELRDQRGGAGRFARGRLARGAPRLCTRLWPSKDLSTHPGAPGTSMSPPKVMTSVPRGTDK